MASKPTVRAIRKRLVTMLCCWTYLSESRRRPVAESPLAGPGELRNTFYNQTGSGVRMPARWTGQACLAKGDKEATRGAEAHLAPCVPPESTLAAFRSYELASSAPKQAAMMLSASISYSR